MNIGPSEKVVVKDRGWSFDKYLIEKNKQYKMIVFMKLQFFFDDGSGGKWTATEKTSFVSTWEAQVKSKWAISSLTKTKDGSPVALDFRFKTQIGGWMWDHWELSVTKIKPSEFATSSVTSFFNNSALDSNDIQLTSKGHGQKQRASVHEFGHMLGLDDEYPAGHTHAKSYHSIMNRGETIAPRHRKNLKDWAEKHLPK